jgi:hypothetical protein
MAVAAAVPPANVWRDGRPKCRKPERRV